MSYDDDYASNHDYDECCERCGSSRAYHFGLCRACLGAETSGLRPDMFEQAAKPKRESEAEKQPEHVKAER